MIKQLDDKFLELQKIISQEKKIVKGIISLSQGINKAGEGEEKLILSQLSSLKKEFQDNNLKFQKVLERIALIKPLKQESNILQGGTKKKLLSLSKRDAITSIERNTIKRLKKQKIDKIKIKDKKPSMYVKTANKIFFKFSEKLTKKYSFGNLERNLEKANLRFILTSYVSLILFTTFLSTFAGIVFFIFILFFSIDLGSLSIVISQGSLLLRAAKFFWVIFLFPAAAFLFSYVYPSIERKSRASRINRELPFATIHMSAISGSLVTPKRIFEIIISTKEYPLLRQEFTKLINEINLHGKNLVSALRTSAFNSPSEKLSELFNGIATTISSGGDLQEFFDKRAQTLLFDHKIQEEKDTKTAETFMDIYISIVIAAPMILMLLLMMMKISGLGISLSTQMITLIMVMGVSAINILFLTFLHIKQPSK